MRPRGHPNRIHRTTRSRTRRRTCSARRSWLRPPSAFSAGLDVSVSLGSGAHVMTPGLTRRMVLASGLLAILVAASFLILLLAITNLRESTQQRRETREGLVAAEELEKLVIDLETGLRGFVITNEERFLEPWNEARAAFPEEAGALERVVADDPSQLARARRITQDGASYIQDYAPPLLDAVRRNGASARSVARTEEGKRRVDTMRAEFEAFRSAARANLAEREADADSAGRRALIAGAAGLAGSILLVL